MADFGVGEWSVEVSVPEEAVQYSEADLDEVRARMHERLYRVEALIREEWPELKVEIRDR